VANPFGPGLILGLLAIVCGAAPAVADRLTWDNDLGAAYRHHAEEAGR